MYGNFFNPFTPFDRLECHALLSILSDWVKKEVRTGHDNKKMRGNYQLS